MIPDFKCNELQICQGAFALHYRGKLTFLNLFGSTYLSVRDRKLQKLMFIEIHFNQ